MPYECEMVNCSHCEEREDGWYCDWYGTDCDRVLSQGCEFVKEYEDDN